MTSIIPADKTSRDELAATGADAAIAWGVSIGFGAILTGADLATRKPKH